MHIASFLGSIEDRLPAGSLIAARVDGIMRELLITATLAVVILGGLTILILCRYRRGSTANRTAIEIPTWKIETAWTLVTLVVFLYFFVRGAALYIDMEQTPVAGDVVHVVARQWMWDMSYDDGRREFNVLHLRQGAPVRLVLSSEDVIHSVFIPAFRLKQDAVPGRLTSTWVTPTRVGTYFLFCAQYCGTAHAEMTGTIIVMSPADFDRWKSEGARGSAIAAQPAGRGRAAYMKYGCARCHEDPSAEKAPSLVGLYGNRVRLEGGHIAVADEQYLHDAILLAPKYMVSGYAPGMPTYAGIISETEASDLASYIESLRAPNRPLASIP